MLARIDTGYVDVVLPEGDAKTAVRVFPNPSKGTVTIETDKQGEDLSVDVCDVAGRVVLKDIRAKSGSSVSFGLGEGTFILNIRQLETNKLTNVKVQFMNF